MAKIETMLILSHDEVNEQIPYKVICESVNRLQTFSAKRKRKEFFTDKEWEACRRLSKLAHSWTLVKGVPDEVRMTPQTYGLWQKFGEFCMMI